MPERVHRGQHRAGQGGPGDSGEQRVCVVGLAREARHDSFEEAAVGVGRGVAGHVACEAARFGHYQLGPCQPVPFRATLLGAVCVAQASAVQAEAPVSDWISAVAVHTAGGGLRGGGAEFPAALGACERQARQGHEQHDNEEPERLSV